MYRNGLLEIRKMVLDVKEKESVEDKCMFGLFCRYKDKSLERMYE